MYTHFLSSPQRHPSKLQEKLSIRCMMNFISTFAILKLILFFLHPTSRDISGFCPRRLTVGDVAVAKLRLDTLLMRPDRGGVDLAIVMKTSFHLKICWTNDGTTFGERFWTICWFIVPFRAILICFAVFLFFKALEVWPLQLGSSDEKPTFGHSNPRHNFLKLQFSLKKGHEVRRHDSVMLFFFSSAPYLFGENASFCVFFKYV